MRGYPYFSLWIPIALAKIYFFPRGPNLVQKPLYLVATVLKRISKGLWDNSDCLLQRFAVGR